MRQTQRRQIMHSFSRRFASSKPSAVAAAAKSTAISVVAVCYKLAQFLQWSEEFFRTSSRAASHCIASIYLRLLPVRAAAGSGSLLLRHSNGLSGRARSSPAPVGGSRNSLSFFLLPLATTAAACFSMRATFKCACPPPPPANDEVRQLSALAR